MRYDAPSGRVVKKFFSILVVELGGIQARKWNSDWVIVFQSVILQHVQLVTGAKNICAQTESGLDFWNHGAFEKLVTKFTPRIEGTQGKLAGSKSRSNVIVHFWIFFYVDTCVM